MSKSEKGFLSPPCNSYKTSLPLLMEIPPPLKRHKPTLDPDSNPDNNQKRDIISNLPDSILSHIHSKLPTKTALSTSFLSTRYKNLFLQIPNPDLNIQDRRVSSPDSPRLKTNFVQYFNHVLKVALKDVPRVHRCIVNLEQGYSDEQVDDWLSDIARIKVSELWLLFKIGRVTIKSDVLLRSAALSTLILHRVCFREVPSSISLPNLNSLFLINVIFMTGDSLERIISACPVLDSLSVALCSFEESVNVFRISSPSIKKLKLSRILACCGDEFYDVVLDIPAIESIHFVDRLPESYSVKNLRHAREAHIDVGPAKNQIHGKDMEEIWLKLQIVRDLVGACSVVRSLFLSNISVNALACSSRPLPTFHNLTVLELGGISIDGWQLLPKFLESAPNLEVLVFKQGFSQYEGCYEAFQSNVSEHVPECFTFHLHTIKFEAFKGEENEVYLVNYFLKQAQFLRNINFELSCSLSSDEISLTRSNLWSSRSQLRKLEVDFVFKVEFDYRALYSAEELKKKG